MFKSFSSRFRQVVAWGWVGEEKRRTMEHEAGDKYFLKLTEVITVAQL